MTNKEQQLLQLIEKRPDISQNDLAELLGISRSSVSVHIVNLMKKGFIKGRGYILAEKESVMVIGGANMDLLGFSRQEIILEDSNPGQLIMSHGGVARNIAENLARMEVPTSLITAIGKDAFGSQIIDECELAGIDCKRVFSSASVATSTYLAIMNYNGEMVLALSHMDSIEQMPLAHLEENIAKIQAAKVVVLDTNLTEEALFTISKAAKGNVFVDTVSVAKAPKILNSLAFVHTIKVNFHEAKALANIEVTNEKTARQLGQFFFERGTQRVAITLGEKGAYLITPTSLVYKKPQPITPVNATGAGDAFMAALVYCWFYDKAEDFTLAFAQAASKITLMNEKAVHPKIHFDEIIKVM